MGVQLHLCIDKSAVISRGESNLKGLVVVALGVLQEVLGELQGGPKTVLRLEGSVRFQTGFSRATEGANRA